MNVVNYVSYFTEIRNYLAGREIGLTRDKIILDELVKCLFSYKLSNLYDYKDFENTELISKKYRESFKKVKKSFNEHFKDSDEILLDPSSIAFIHNIFNKIDFENPEHDPLSDLYQTFASTELKGNEGQFFTPSQAVSWIIQALDPVEGERIIDPSCGTGSFLYNAAKYLISKGVDLTSISSNIYGVEKDEYLAQLASSHLNFLTKEKSNIFCGDSIERIDLNKNPLEIEFENSFDIVVANPPFGSKIKVGSTETKERMDLAKKWKFNQESNNYEITDNLVTNPSPQILFLEICIKLLKPKGRLGIVVPESMVSANSKAHVVAYLMENMKLEGVIGMPESLFKTSGKGGTHTKTCLLIAEKKEIISKSFSNDIFFAEAGWCGNDSRGNIIDKNDLPSILNKYKTWKAKEKINFDNFGHLVKSSDIISNVLAPRYYNPGVKKSLGKLNKTHDLINLGELIDSGIVEVSTGDEVGKLSYGTGPIPFIRTSDISNWEIKLDPKQGVSEEIYKKYSEKQDVQENDILMVRDGTYLIGTTAIISKFDTKIVYQSHLYKLRVNQNELITPYLLLASLSSKPVIDQIISKRFTQDIIDTLGNRISELVLPIPKDENQKIEIDNMVKKSINDRFFSRELARQAKIKVAD